MEVTVKMPGTCGELVQGVLDGVNFHVTCPIDLYSHVTVKVNRSLAEIKINQRAEKTLAAIKKTLEYFNYEDAGLEINLRSELFSGKGMASSTADIVAGIVATTLALGERVSDDLIKKIALEIEPTDGSFLSGIVSFDHLQGKKVTRLGKIEPIPLLIFDIGGLVDTLDFNSRKELPRLKLAKEEKVKSAYKLVKSGIRTGDLQLIGQGTTLSSLANQSILFKPYLDELIKLAQKDKDILGINIAHSGTLIGVLIDPKVTIDKVLTKIKFEIPKLNFLIKTKIISGGYQVIRKG